MELLDILPKVLSALALLAIAGLVAFNMVLGYKNQKIMGSMIRTYTSMSESFRYMQQSFTSQQKALDHVVSWTIPPEQWEGVIELYSTMREMGSDQRDYLIWATGRDAWFKSSEHGYTKDLLEAKRFTAVEAMMLVLDRSRNADPYDVYALVSVQKQD